MEAQPALPCRTRRAYPFSAKPLAALRPTAALLVDETRPEGSCLGQKSLRFHMLRIVLGMDGIVRGSDRGAEGHV